MKLFVVVVIALSACAFEDEEAVATTESELASPEGQGADYQGADYQGADYQGADYQGADYQGADYQGASYGGATLSDSATLSGTALTVWTRSGTDWHQRTPNKICYWNSTRTVQIAPCRSFNISLFPSPLVGVTFKASFRKLIPGTKYFTTITGKIRIDGVRTDSQLAMHPLEGHTTAATCGIVPKGTSNCEHPAGCRRNCDVFLYRLTLIDNSDGDEHPFCNGGVYATAVPGVYSSTGQLTSSSTRFTFACTNGTIAKCTRWGYRGFGTARKCYGNSSTCTSGSYSLAPYHQTCVRAAAADYCANGKSFTKNGTLVDIYDYEAHGSGWGFVPRTRSSAVVPDATAFVTEAGFDRYGAHQIAHLRYMELSETPHYGDIDSTPNGCPGKFYETGSDDVLGALKWARGDINWDGSSTIWIDSAPACSHSELQRGKWLHESCSSCTNLVDNDASYAYCTDPTDERGWDHNCVARAEAVCAAPMTSHRECTVGTGLRKYATGCTLAVCSTPGYESCCNETGENWTSSCVSRANSVCTVPGFGNPLNGFCSAMFPPVFENSL